MGYIGSENLSVSLERTLCGRILRSWLVEECHGRFLADPYCFGWRRGGRYRPNRIVLPAIEPSPIPGVEVKAEEGTQLALAQTPAPSPAGPKASEALVNPTLAEVIVSNAKATGTPARPEDLPAAPAATGISVESPSANATPAPAIALATPAPAFTPAIAKTPEVSVVTAPIVASTPEASSPSPAPAATSAAPAVAATPAPELAAGTPAQQPVIEPTASAAPVVATAMSATPATVLTPA